MFERMMFWRKPKKIDPPKEEVSLARMKYKDALENYGSDHAILIALFEKYPARRMIEDQRINHFGPMISIMYGYLREEYFRKNPK